MKKKRGNNPEEKQTKDLMRQLTEEKTQIANRHEMIQVREMQIKPRRHLVPTTTRILRTGDGGGRRREALGVLTQHLGGHSEHKPPGEEEAELEKLGLSKVTSTVRNPHRCSQQVCPGRPAHRSTGM